MVRDKKSGELVLTSMWAKMPDLMLSKCASARAPQAFPNDSPGPLPRAMRWAGVDETPARMGAPADIKR
jgi:hypothetical protein